MKCQVLVQYVRWHLSAKYSEKLICTKKMLSSTPQNHIMLAIHSGDLQTFTMGMTWFRVLKHNFHRKHSSDGLAV